MLKLYTLDCVVILYVNTGFLGSKRSHLLYLKLETLGTVLPFVQFCSYWNYPCFILSRYHAIFWSFSAPNTKAIMLFYVILFNFISEIHPVNCSD